MATTATVTNFAALFRRQTQLFLFISLMRISTEWTVFLVLSCGLDLRTTAKSSEILVVAALWAGGKVRHCNCGPYVTNTENIVFISFNGIGLLHCSFSCHRQGPKLRSVRIYLLGYTKSGWEMQNKATVLEHFHMMLSVVWTSVCGRYTSL